MAPPSESRLLDDHLGLTNNSQPREPQAPKNRDDLLKQFEQRARDGASKTNNEMPDDAVKAASHGVKVLAPLLAAISRHVDLQNPEAVQGLMEKALLRVREDATTVAKAFRVNPDDAPVWLVSQIAGNLMPVMVNALERGSKPILDGDTSYLLPMLQLAEQAKEQPLKNIAFSGDPEWQLLQALAIATSTVMTEYQAWDYWITDAVEVAEMISDHLHDRVIEQTLTHVVERWQLNDAEKANIGVTLLHHAGQMLASCWTAGMDRALETVKGMDRPQQRHVLAHGYPLDHVFEDFENLYQGIEVSIVSALRTLAPSRERAIKRTSPNETLR